MEKIDLDLGTVHIMSFIEANINMNKNYPWASMLLCQQAHIHTILPEWNR
jgi:hypothetical protein